MKDELPININDTIMVKLTDFGRGWYQSYYYSITGKHVRGPVVDASGYSKFQFNQLALIFGPLLSVGNTEMPFISEMKLVTE